MRHVQDSPAVLAPVVVIASSAGGLHALTAILSELPSSFPVAIVVVQHMAPHHRSFLAEILQRRTPLAVKQAEQDDHLRAGTVYIAPPDQHVLVQKSGHLALSHAERVRFLRPSADLLLESAAISYGRHAIAVILTGTGRDGAQGVRAIKEHGGTVIAQDEATAEYSGMPAAAIETGCVDITLPLDEIAATLVGLLMPGATDEQHAQ